MEESLEILELTNVYMGRLELFVMIRADVPYIRHILFIEYRILVRVVITNT